MPKPESKLVWEDVQSTWANGKVGGGFQRAKVPGGWLIMNYLDNTLTFMPDPDHSWS